MIKMDELANSNSCLNRAKDDETIFVLLARDIAAPIAIRAWVAARIRHGKNKLEDDQMQTALADATKMEIYFLRAKIMEGK